MDNEKNQGDGIVMEKCLFYPNCSLGSPPVLMNVKSWHENRIVLETVNGQGNIIIDRNKNLVEYVEGKKSENKSNYAR